jgi:riboflavin synthase
MFTGLIETACRIDRIQRLGDALRIFVDLGPICADCRAGESIAVNGVCLTIAEIAGQIAAFDVSSETLAKSTLGKLTPGAIVNIERAVKADGRFGGHFVQGHIDGVGRIENIDRRGEFWRVRFAADADLLEQMVNKGSVAVDGISLTVAELDKNGFEVAIIPETINRTNLQNAKVADAVNIETDLIVKVVQKQLLKVSPQKEDITIEKLQELGF